MGFLGGPTNRGTNLIFLCVLCQNQGGRKEGRRNEPVGSCAMCDARSTGSKALECKNR